MSEKKQYLVTNGGIEDVIKTAASNATSIKNMAIAIDSVDPKELRLDDTIFTIVGVPVDDEDTSPNASLMVAIKAIQVDSLAGSIKHDHITINGTIDIPKHRESTVGVFKCFFKTKEEAHAVCKVLAEVEYDRAIAILTKAQNVVATLDKQNKDLRF